MSSTNDYLAVACGGDENFALPIATTLYSVASNLPPETNLHVFILDGGICELSRRRISHVLTNTKMDTQVEWVKPNLSALHGLPTTDLLNRSIYLRFLIPEIVPYWIDNIVYLDADTIVERSLHDLLEVHDDNYPITAVRDFGGPYAASSYGLSGSYETLGIDDLTPLFNTGVMVINPPRWRAEDITERAFNYAERLKGFVQLPIQEVLNATLANKWKEVDWRWNVQVGALQSFDAWEDTPFKMKMRPHVDQLLRNPYIAHFIGPRKPWRAGLTNPLRPRFTHYLKESGWFTPMEFKQWYLKWLASSLSHIGYDLWNSPPHAIKRAISRIR